MIKLLKNKTTSLKAVETRLKTLNTKAEYYNFFSQFIKEYQRLNDLYCFTEALDENYIFAQIDLQLEKRNLPLHCIPIGVKDIFNTKVLPTSMGSEIWKGFKAGNNARAVDEVIEHGGIVFSKTTTAEFAVHFITPEKTINPYNKNHITGTSSSGSAVAVSCGALPVSIGTQTAGSIIRPASFCGVYGFKPSFGAIDRTGVLKTNDTLDTIGLLSSDVHGLRKTFSSIFQNGTDYPFSKNYFTSYEKYKARSGNKLNIAYLAEGFTGFSYYQQYVKDDFKEVLKAVGNSFNLQELNNVDFINQIHKLHEIIYCKSLSYYFQNEAKNYHSVSSIMQQMIANGETVTNAQYIDAIKSQPLIRERFDKIFEEFNFIITPSTASCAPILSETELDDTCLIWTFLGYPAISMPLFFNENLNLPYGLQIVAKKFDDFALFDFTELVESHFIA